MKRLRILKGSVRLLVILSILNIFAVNGLAQEKKFQWSARLTLSEQYDDNLFLDKDNKEFDWLTIVGPGLTLAILTEKTPINLDYDLGFTHYARDKESDHVRHSLSLTGFRGVPIANHVTLDLNENLNITDDTISPAEGVISVRRDRQRYIRNTAGARINYLFGAEDSLYAGFDHIYLNNNDSTIDDSQRYGPRAGIAYWFNIRNGLSINLSHDRGFFDNTTTDDFEQNIGNAAYTYRFSPRTQTTIAYNIDDFDYNKGIKEDYVVHRGTLGFNHQFTKNTSLLISGGYWLQKRDVSDDRDGFAGTVNFTQSREKLSFTLAGSGGYRQQLNEAENLGFSRFYRASVTLDWSILEKLTANVSGFYQRDDYKETPTDREDDNFGGRASLDYLLLPGLSASLSYDYRRRDSDISSEEFTNNRVTFRLVGFYLSKPKSF